MLARRSRWLGMAPFGALLVVGCPGPTPAEDGGVEDGGVEDGGVEDGGDNDARVERDVGTEDAPAPGDAGFADDAADGGAGPCVPAACTEVPAPSCEGTATLRTFEASCGPDGACVYLDELSPCPASTVCFDGACVPDPLCMAAFEGATGVVTRLAIGNHATGTAPADACCTDFGTDGVVDNRLGVAIRALDSLDGSDTNALIAERIATASTLTAVLFDARPDRGADALDVGFVPATLVSADLSAIPAGTAELLLERIGFVDGTAEPRSHLAATLAGTSLRTVTTSRPNEVVIEVPLLGLDVAWPLVDARLEGTLTAGPSGASGRLSGEPLGARLSGLAPLDQALGAISDAYAARCPCAVFPLDSGDRLFNAAGTCVRPDTLACTGADSDACIRPPGLCGALRSLLGPDVDTDADGTNDAISSGFWLETTTATVVGVEACGG